MKASILMLTISLIVSLSAHTQVYVKQDATGSNNGTNWQDAYTNLDTAISRTIGGSIWVAKGNYKPSVTVSFGTFKAFVVNKKIALYGGFNGNESSFAQRDILKNITILNGDIGVAGDSSDNTPQVVVIYGTDVDSTTVLDGFTIKGAYYTEYKGYSYGNGAVVVQGPQTINPVISNCRITENHGFSGAGIWVGRGRPLITSNEIFNNNAFEGAGIYIEYANPRITGNHIYNNVCVGSYSHLAGGAIKIAAYSAPFITGNLIENNAASLGGAISNESNYEVTISNNVISHNSGRDGGAVYVNGSNTQFINNLVAGNFAAGSGGALYLDYTLMNCTNNTFTGNSSISYGGAFCVYSATLVATNNIIYNNPSVQNKPLAIFGQGTMLPRFNYNDIENGISSIYTVDSSVLSIIWEAGNISKDPSFLDASNYNFQLASQSACINKGAPDTTALNLPALDIALNKRFSGSTIDIGCYEFDNAAIQLPGLSTAPHAVQLKGSADSSFAITIQGNENWTINNVPDWLTLSKTSGTGNAVVQVSAEANKDLFNAKSVKLLINSSRLNAPAVPVRIDQSQGAYISLGTDTARLSNDNFRIASFPLKANVGWAFTTYGWVRATPNNGQPGTYNISITADSNLTGNTRTLPLVFADSYFNPRVSDTLIVVQQPTLSKVCAGSTVKFYAGIPNATYQWQVSGDSGFHNLPEGTGFTGTTTATLSIASVLSSSYGTQYKCLVDGANGPVYTIQIANTWINNTSAWESPSNWSCGKLPDANTDVIVYGGNLTISSNVTVRSMSVTNGSTVTVQPGYSLTILH